MTGFVDELRATTAPTWDAAVGHQFVDELWAGTIDNTVMARYLAQDAQFLDGFVALLGAAVSNADDPVARMAIARQLGFVASDENGYFTRALDHLGVDPSATVLAAPTRGFLDLMDETRAAGEYGPVLCVLLVAEALYLDWAERDQEPPADWLHREWIDLHRGEAFVAWVALLRGEVDRVAALTDDAGRARMQSAFVGAVDLELAFFDAAYDARDS